VPVAKPSGTLLMLIIPAKPNLGVGLKDIVCEKYLSLGNSITQQCVMLFF
jgi:hypothetical protein